MFEQEVTREGASLVARVMTLSAFGGSLEPVFFPQFGGVGSLVALAILPKRTNLQIIL